MHVKVSNLRDSHREYMRLQDASFHRFRRLRHILRLFHGHDLSRIRFSRNFDLRTKNGTLIAKLYIIIVENNKKFKCH